MNSFYTLLIRAYQTPEKPEYKGGSWHVEGMLNERIVASGIYYYDQECVTIQTSWGPALTHIFRNITSSELAFRIAIQTPDRANRIQAETYDYYAFYKLWGLEMDYDE